ncbi:glycerate kinase [Peribacillus frigoritolerans]|nr:glycerate kinase [Peribacillus frigoritolerans]
MQKQKRGIDIVMEYTKLGKKLSGADCVFTGEGQIDYQTASGKTPMGVAQEAKKHGIPGICFGWIDRNRY